VQLQRPNITAAYLSAVAECQYAGAKLLPEDYVWLYHASQRAVGVHEGDCPQLVEVPVIVGNVTLWPITMGARMWWKAHGEGWYAGQGETEVIAVAYCMANGRDADFLETVATKSRADASLVKWQLGTSSACTVAELAWGIDKVNGQIDYVDIVTKAMSRKLYSATDWGDVIARLCATYQRPPEYFLWQIGERAAIEMLDKAPLPAGYDRGKDAGITQAMREFKEITKHIINIRSVP
jgi:hypothetical protein